MSIGLDWEEVFSWSLSKEAWLLFLLLFQLAITFPQSSETWAWNSDLSSASAMVFNSLPRVIPANMGALLPIYVNGHHGEYSRPLGEGDLVLQVGSQAPGRGILG